MQVIEINIPFTEEELDTYFDKIEEYVFVVNVDKSEYQGKALLNYVYNTNMQCDFKIENYNKAIEDLLIEYIQTDKLLSIPALNELWINIVRNRIDDFLPEKDEQYNRFIVTFKNNHIDLINELACILSSLKIFLMNVLIEAKIEAEDKEIENIGNNMISLRENPYFWKLLSDVEKLNFPYYHYPHFESNSYDGYKISYYFYSEFSPLSIIKICTDLLKKEQ